MQNNDKKVMQDAGRAVRPMFPEMVGHTIAAAQRPQVHSGLRDGEHGRAQVW